MVTFRGCSNVPPFADECRCVTYRMSVRYLWGGGGRVRVRPVWLETNNGGKVSNLTVAPHQFIPLPFYHRKGGPVLLQIECVLWESLHRITRSPLLLQISCLCGGYLTILHRAIKYYTEMHMTSTEEHSALNKTTPQEE